MNADIKKKWVDALRSGNYQQARERLRRGDQYCCLGVLCDIINPEGWLVRSDDDQSYYCFGRDSAYLPRAMVDELQFSDRNLSRLMSMNDQEKLSFTEIADFIEANL